MKLKSAYRCQECGYTSLKWLGQCPQCEKWNSLTEEILSERSVKGSASRSVTSFSSEVVRLSSSSGKDLKRIPTAIEELDHILGGGLVPGQVLLLAGPPGIGKSTLMLQAAASLAGLGTGDGGLVKNGQRGASPDPRSVLYISGEESLDQVSQRAFRLGLEKAPVDMVSETSLERILEILNDSKPSFVVLDSVQTVFHPDLAGASGSVGQVRECASELLRWAKGRGAVLFLLGHVTKEGALAGPKVLEHIVDTVLYFETERQHYFRVLRAHKNRYGPTSEAAVFEMKESGLSQVRDVSQLFLEERSETPQPGRAISVVLEGARPLLVEVQALVVPTRYPYPRRMATGFDLNRLLVLLASMERHLKVRLEQKDVFLNLTGGMKIKDPSVDLAVVWAVLSSLREKVIGPEWVFVAEVGLLGDLRRVPLMSSRLKEAQRLGFKKALVSKKSLKDLQGLKELQASAAAHIGETLSLLEES